MADDLWKKPDPEQMNQKHTDAGLGIWSRSFALRVVAWWVTVPVVIVLAIYVSSRLSGFESPLEMIDWLRTSFNR